MVPPDYVINVWAEVAPILSRALKTAEGRYTIADLFEECCGGGQTLWIAFDDQKRIVGALTTRVVNYPSRKMLSGQFCGGTRMAEWQDQMLRILDIWAKDNDCSGFVMTGRYGWERILRRYGWRPIAKVYVKDY